MYWVVQTVQLLIMHISAASYYFLPRRPNYVPQHPILKLL